MKKNLKLVYIIIVIALMLFFVPNIYKRMRVLKGISGKEKSAVFDKTESGNKLD